ncbi:MAG: HDOD domain-containing protein [Gammaproteobacteria bacterium]|nr:HDOD domain-containing protein [Gammaproteobacteria bacterium]
MPTVAELINRNIQLISLPEIISRINIMINDPNASATDIGKLISQDPALTARLLKVINSPLYKLSKPVENVTAAVNILGTRQLRDLVIAQAVIKRFTQKISQNFDIEAFWCHSITTGVAAKIIANAIRMSNTERFFIAGLLHDIGKMVLYLLLPKEALQLQRLVSKPDIDAKKAEHNLLGFTHGEIGAELLRSWNFPDSLIDACAYHHSPKDAQTYPQEAAITHIANGIANNIQAPISADDDTVIEDYALRLFGLTQPMIERFHEEVYQQFDEILKVLFYDLAA